MILIRILCPGYVNSTVVEPVWASLYRGAMPLSENLDFAVPLFFRAIVESLGVGVSKEFHINK